MKTASILQASLLLICCGLALCITGLKDEDRRVCVDVAIASVKQEFARSQESAKSLSSPESKLHAFKMSTAASRAQGNARLRFEKMVKRAEMEILERERLASAQTAEQRAETLAMEVLHRPGSLLTKQDIARIYQESDCHSTVTAPQDCSAFTSQRTADGTCNNLQHPTFGAANTPMRRLIPPRYDDGVSRLQGTLQIRRLSIVPGPFSPPNPSPRVVSLGVVGDRPLNDSKFSHLLMQWGQFMDHDLDAIPEFEGRCPSGCAVEENSCVPFPVPQDDMEVSRISGPDSQFCHAFRRSQPACDQEMPEAVTPREQLNSLTHWIDGSMVYHHDPDVQMNLIRDKDSDGLLRVGPPVPGTSRASLPTIDTTANPGVVACPMPPIGDGPPCFLAGDFRVNEHTALTVMHTLWVREHNRIARALRSGNSQLSSEELFQTTRNIVIAEIQKITYKDYLPLLLGDSFLDLVPEYSGYNSTVDPNIPNAFATAAYRYGHSQIQPFFDRLDENYRPISAGPLALVEAFFDTSHFTEEGGVDPILRGLLTRNAREVDEFLNSILTNQLFAEDPDTPGMDLAALNVQRSRDHGLPTYLTWKQWAKRECGVESDFRNQLTQVRLLQTYGSLANVDLFVGGLAEEPLPGGLVGAIFGCIFARTFSALRDGDRFYYENAAGAMPLFTPAQRRAIEMASLSRVICDNTGITEIQPDAFMANQNRVPCSQLPSVDLSLWGEGGSGPGGDLCYIRITNGNAPTSSYTAISQLLGTTMSRSVTRSLGSMSTDCLSFLCPTDEHKSKLTVVSSNTCLMMLNENLRNRFRIRRRVYRQFLETEDIADENGLYTSLQSCVEGDAVALSFCAGGPDEEMDKDVDEEMDKDMDKEMMMRGSHTNSAHRQQDEMSLPKKNLREMLSNSGLSGDEINEILEDLGEDGVAAEAEGEGRDEEDSQRLIALMEEVLSSLKSQSSSSDSAAAAGAGAGGGTSEEEVQEKSIKELDEALKQLNKN